uniref:Phosphatidylserine decarboxylase n=1 Tax=Brassica oleracea var. oleracea TaxID=109376 RepID=A0A0D3E500_BRAOL
MDQGAKEILQKLSEKHGKKMNTVESALKIASFLKFFKHFKVEEEIVFIVSTLHSDEFFIMELKPGARTMAYMNRDDVAVCAADCRLMVFQSVEDSTRFWIKGRKFSIRGLLGKNVNRNAFLDGSLVIFRLAPQDYHGFHVPVSGVIEKFGDVSRCLYTVNPIAINSKYCNELTENNRTLAIISTSEFGKVHFTQNPLSLHAALEVG